MEKTILILIILVLLAGGCGRTEKKQTAETTMPDKTYVGTWHTADNPPDELILEIDSMIRFELGIYRIITTTGTAEIENNKIVFVTDCGLSGTLKFNENSILVTVDKSDFTYIQAGTTYNFTIKVDEKNLQRKVKYLYQAEGVNYICFDDGTAYKEIEDHEADESDLIISGKINPENPGNIKSNAAYKEFPTYLVFNGENYKWNFFDDFGHIEWGWRIINYHRVFSLFQITNFEPETANISAKDIQAIKETCLIFIIPENAYEEWMWYQDDRKKEYETKVIPSVDAQKRYLSFTLYDGEKIIVDTKKKQNSIIPPSALLYRKGYIPIMISISGESEEGTEQIKAYLSKSAPFERWSTLKEK